MCSVAVVMFKLSAPLGVCGAVVLVQVYEHWTVDATHNGLNW